MHGIYTYDFIIEERSTCAIVSIATNNATLVFVSCSDNGFTKFKWQTAAQLIHSDRTGRKRRTKSYSGNVLFHIFELNLILPSYPPRKSYSEQNRKLRHDV